MIVPKDNLDFSGGENMSLNLEEEEESGELPYQQREKKPDPQDTERYNLASRFIDAITSGQEPRSQLCSVLKARGFLLEDDREPNYDPKHIYLSDNSHASDALNLDNLLRKNKIGHIFSDDSPYLGRRYQDEDIPPHYRDGRLSFLGISQKNHS